MALPVAGILMAASAAVKIGSAVADHLAANEQAEEQLRATSTAANRALKLKRRDLSIRGIEESQSAADRRLQGLRQATGAQGRSRASAASAGVEGQSADALISTISGDLGRFYQSVDYNLQVTLDQLDRVEQGAEAERDARINSVPTQGGSLAQTLLRIGGAGLDLAGGFMANRPSGADIPVPGNPDDYDSTTIPIPGGAYG